MVCVMNVDGCGKLVLDGLLVLECGVLEKLGDDGVLVLVFGL